MPIKKPLIYRVVLNGGPCSSLLELFNKNRIYIDVSERVFYVCFNLKFAA